MPRGKKTCPGCDAVVGVRTRTCECGHVFVPKSQIPKDSPPPAIPSPPTTHMTGPPTYIPASKGVKRCATHPKYTGESNPPKSGCPVCWRMYLKEKHDLPIEYVQHPKVITITDRREMQRFLHDLKTAIESAAVSGGLYSAFLHGKGGTLQIDVQSFTGRDTH